MASKASSKQAAPAISSDADKDAIIAQLRADLDRQAAQQGRGRAGRPISAQQADQLDRWAAHLAALPASAGGSEHNRDSIRAIWQPAIDGSDGPMPADFDRLYRAAKADPRFCFAPHNRAAHFGITPGAKRAISAARRKAAKA